MGSVQHEVFSCLVFSVCCLGLLCNQGLDDADMSWALGFHILGCVLQASKTIVARELPNLAARLPMAPDADGTYAAARTAAAAAGATAGPLLLLDFACSGRGTHLYERRGPVEARLMAEASPGGCAVAGCFVNGEIGPVVVGGGFGLRSKQVSLQKDTPQHESLSPALQQTYTSVFVGVGEVLAG